MTPEQAKELIHCIGMGFALVSTWLAILCVIQFLRLMRRQ